MWQVEITYNKHHTEVFLDHCDITVNEFIQARLNEGRKFTYKKRFISEPLY